MTTIRHLTTEEIEKNIDRVIASPMDDGVLELIVRRPREGEREVLDAGELDAEKGLTGDVWATDDGNLETQIAIMNSRFVDLIAQDKERWKIAGDQLYIDMNLTDENLPAGTRLAIGSAVIEVTPEPHTGCRLFVERFGRDAMIYTNSPTGKKYHLRGIYAKVVRSGTIRRGDSVRKI
jgi:hypothetical protein